MNDYEILKQFVQKKEFFLGIFFTLASEEK